MSIPDGSENICKCGRKLEQGESSCPACKGDNASLLEGVGTVLVSLVAVVVGVVGLFVKRE